MSAFEILNKINVNNHTEKKNGLTYLSWAWAWAEVKKAFPDSTYTVYENADGWNYHTDGKTAWVKTGVTIEGLEHIEYLPVMNYKNQSIPVDQLTSFDVNKAIQRSLTKAVARHGLGLYIYAGEDLPEADLPKFDPEKVGVERIDQIKANALFKEADEAGVSVDQILRTYGIGSIFDMTEKQFSDCHIKLQKTIKLNAKRGLKDGRENP